MALKRLSFLGKCMVAFLTIVEILILVLIGWNFKKNLDNRISLQYRSDDLRAFTSEVSEACFGGSIDEEYYAGLYDIIPSMYLKNGYYRYQITYSSTSPGSYCWPDSYSENYNLMDWVATWFMEGSYTNSEEFWLNSDQDLALRLYYSGSGEITILEFSIEETNVLAILNLCEYLLLWISANVLLYLIWRKKYRPIEMEAKYIALALFAIAIISSYPLLVGYCINGQELFFHLTRIEGMADALRCGQFPVRINPTFYNGYGYASPSFCGNFFLYFPALMRLCGLRLSTAYNIYVEYVNVVTILIAYYSFRKLLNDRFLGVGCTLLYALAPYRITCLYLRAAVSEFTAMAFLPLMVYGVFRIYREDYTDPNRNKWCFLPLALALGGLLQTDVVIGFICCGVSFIVCLMMIRKTLNWKRVLAILNAFGLTFMLNLWTLVPMIDFYTTQQLKLFQNPGDLRIQRTGLYLAQLWSLFSGYSWGQVDAVNGLADEMPVSLGLPLSLGLVLFLGMIMGPNISKDEKRLGVNLFHISLITLFMSTVYFPWDWLSNRSTLIEGFAMKLEYAWRMLTPAIALTAACTGCGLKILQREKGKHASSVAVVALAVLSLVASMYFMQECLENQSPIVLNTIKDLGVDTEKTANGGKYMLTGTSYTDFTERFTPRAYSGVLVKDFRKLGTSIMLSVQANDETDGYVLLPLVAYKGYRVASDDGVIDSSNLFIGEHSVLEVDIPAGYSGTLHIDYQGMWYWRLAEVISLLSVIVVCARLIHWRRR